VKSFVEILHLIYGQSAKIFQNMSKHTILPSFSLIRIVIKRLNRWFIWYWNLAPIVDIIVLRGH
jgi:hypothetical protein